MIILLTNIYLENPSFPFIHPFLCLLYGSQGSAGACPNFQGVRGGYTPDRSPANCRANTQRRTTFTLTSMVTLDWSVHLSRILDCGRKLEWPGNTHSCTKRTCKLLTQNLWSYMLFLPHSIWNTKKITCFLTSCSLDRALTVYLQFDRWEKQLWMLNSLSWPQTWERKKSPRCVQTMILIPASLQNT